MDHSNIIPFAFNDNLVRIVMKDGEPWFVLVDVCHVLNLSNPSKAAERLDDDEKTVIDPTKAGMTLTSSEGHSGPGGARSLNIISESGLYALVFTSRKDEARRFRKWVTAEVLPALRKTGAYEMREALAAHDRTVSQQSADWPVDEIHAKLALVREARKVKGVKAASFLWDLIGLPTIVESAVDENIEAIGFETLDTILNAELHDRRLRDWLAEAIDGDTTARRMLGPIGVVVNDREDGVVFACTTSFLNDLFKGVSRHYLSLRHIAGARKARAYFGADQKRGVMLPLDIIDVMLHGEQAAA